MSDNTNTTDNKVSTNVDEYPPFKLRVKKQNLTIVSILKLNDGRTLFKTGGVFEEYNDALKRIEELKKIDKASFIFVAEVGKWLSIYHDLSKMNEEPNIRNDLLNNFMKSYKECLQDEAQEEQKRKDELLKGANVVTGKHKETGDEQSEQTEQNTMVETNLDVEDHLDEDKPLRQNVSNQNYFNCCILNLQSFPETRRDEFKDVPVWGLKIRGSYEVYEDSAEKAEQSQKIDKYHNVFVGEVGKNYPADIDVATMGSEDQVYREKSLGKYMKSTKGALHEENDTSNNNSTLNNNSVLNNNFTLNDGSTKENLNVMPPAQTVRSTEDNTVSELEKNELEKQKLQVQLDESKSNLANIEEKLSKINELYAKLKSS